MKLKTIAAAVIAAGAVANVNADANGTLPWEVSTTDLFISGASAIDSQVRNYFVSLCSDNGGSVVAFSFSSADLSKTEGYNSYFCDAQISSTASATLGTPAYYVMHKRSAGGSGWGVGPVAGALSIDRLAVSSACTELTVGNTSGDPLVATTDPTPAPQMTGASRQFNCNGALVSDVPEGGVSDVEPALFVGSNLIDPSIPENGGPTGGILAGDPGTVPPSAAELAGLTVSALNQTTFGIQVTKTLRDALQAAQYGVGDSCVGSDLESCMPSLSREVIASLFVTGSRRISDWDDLKVNDAGVIKGLATFAADHGLSSPKTDANIDLGEFGFSGTQSVAPDTRVHVCRRSPGSGTQAQFNALFMNDPCTASANVAARDNDSTTSRVRESYRDNDLVLALGAPAGQGIVHENQGSSDLRDCVNDLNARGAWAAGLNSLEKGKSGVRYIAIDGVTPTLENVNAGKYWDWAGTSLQYRSSISADSALIMSDLSARAISAAEVGTSNKSLDDPFIYVTGSTPINYGALAFPASGVSAVPFSDVTPYAAVNRLDNGGNPSTCNTAIVTGEVLVD